MFLSLFSHPGDQTDPAGLAHPVPAAQKKPGWLASWVIYPFLLAAFPVLRLFAQNSTELPYRELLAPIAFMVTATLVVWGGTWVLLRNPHKAGIFTTLCLIWFYTGSRMPQTLDWLYSGLSWQWVWNPIHFHPLHAMLISVAVLVPIGLLLVAAFKPAAWCTSYLNLFSVVLVALPIAEILRTKPVTIRPASLTGVPFPVGRVPGPAPDIYYLILDGYARSDVMRDLFDYDNSSFLDRLERKGFYVAHSSTANYCQTPLSLSSSLNSEHLEHLVEGKDNDVTKLRTLIAENNLFATLRPLGYKVVTFATSFDPTDLTQTDYYLSPYLHFSEFQRLLIDRTCFWAFLPNPEGLDLFTQTRERTLFMLAHLPEVAADPRPTLTFAHILCPHPPFLFDQDGQDVGHRDDAYYLNDGTRYQGFAKDPKVYVRSYRDQAIYITRRIEEIIEQILARSPQPPILILQSDHGSGLRLNPESLEQTDVRERMSILNAYYFPGHDYQNLYQHITPVNSFRVVLNTFFGAGLKLMPDRNYFSTWTEPYRFIEVTGTVQSSAQRP
jgi:hypothetical protein